MIEIIKSVDIIIFHLINGLPHNFFLDNLFLFFSGSGWAGIFFLIILAGFFVIDEYKDKTVFPELIFLQILVLSLSDFVIKNIIRKPRPFQDLLDVINVGKFAWGYSFPSSHSAVAWASCVFLSFKYPRFKKLFILIALAVSFSRVYLGKHYPSDVLAGALFGGIIAFGYTLFINWLSNRKKDGPERERIKDKRAGKKNA